MVPESASHQESISKKFYGIFIIVNFCCLRNQPPNLVAYKNKHVLSRVCRLSGLFFSSGLAWLGLDGLGWLYSQ